MGFLFLGIGVGALGTLIGAGGGFILVPLLLWQFPLLAPAEITAMSMLAVAANGASGSIAYAFKKQIHWRSAILFSLFALPGIWVGLALSEKIERDTFEPIFGAVLGLLAAYLLMHSRSKRQSAQAGRFTPNSKKYVLGSVFSLGVGAVGSFLGIGGGIIHVPLLASVLFYPVHLATGTSHFILCVTAAVASFLHWKNGDYAQTPAILPLLIIGVIVGAQLGARLSKRVKSETILRILAAALLVAAFRLVTR